MSSLRDPLPPDQTSSNQPPSKLSVSIPSDSLIPIEVLSPNTLKETEKKIHQEQRRQIQRAFNILNLNAVIELTWTGIKHHSYFLDYYLYRVSAFSYQRNTDQARETLKNAVKAAQLRPEAEQKEDLVRLGKLDRILTEVEDYYEKGQQGYKHAYPYALGRLHLHMSSTTSHDPATAITLVQSQEPSFYPMVSYRYDENAARIFSMTYHEQYYQYSRTAALGMHRALYVLSCKTAHGMTENRMVEVVLWTAINDGLTQELKSLAFKKLLDRNLPFLHLDIRKTTNRLYLSYPLSTEKTLEELAQQQPFSYSGWIQIAMLTAEHLVKLHQSGVCFETLLDFPGDLAFHVDDHNNPTKAKLMHFHGANFKSQQQGTAAPLDLTVKCFAMFFESKMQDLPAYQADKTQQELFKQAKGIVQSKRPPISLFTNHPNMTQHKGKAFYEEKKEEGVTLTKS